jgi:acetyl esterase/lipase
VALLLCLAALVSGCTRFDVLNATVSSRGYGRTPDLSYGGLPRQKLDIYRPRRPAPNAGVVVFFYGGDWRAGSKDDYRFVAEALTSRGYVAVLPDYRLYPAVTFPTFVEDGAMAIRWVKDNIARYGGDPDRVYLMGHSAGAHIAALLTLDGRYLNEVGLKRSAIRAAATLSGPYDFHPGGDSAVFEMSPDDSTPDPRMEPITFADGSAPPMLLVHGASDTIVLPANATHLAERIRGLGGQVRVILYPGVGHVGVALALAAPFRGIAPVLNDTVTFFAEH